MIGSFRIATIRGIPIRVHFTLVAMLAVLVATFWSAGPLVGLVAAVVLFGSVLLHELGHSVVAQHYRIPISSITLHLLGGVALMTRPPASAKEEIHIAAAGPLVSLMLGVVFCAILWLIGAPIAVDRPSLLVYAAVVNLGMCIFNLIPALPMDGGRIFRAALSAKLGSLRATRVAATVSRVFAVGFILLGLLGAQWAFLLIGTLLFFMASHEVRVAEAQQAMRDRMQSAPSWPTPLSDLGDRGTVRETREEYIDPWGRRYVVITRLI